jgi:hypothetical protein
MARHRLLPHTEEPGLVCRSPRVLVVGRFDQHRRATLRQWVIRMARSSAPSIASITSLVLACAVSGAAGRVPPPAPALPRVAITPVAIDGAAGSAVSGPAVVAVARPPASLHIAAVTKSAPPSATKSLHPFLTERRAAEDDQLIDTATKRLATWRLARSSVSAGHDVVEFCDCRLRRGSMMSSATGCMTVVMTPDGSSREKTRTREKSRAGPLR